MAGKTGNERRGKWCSVFVTSNKSGIGYQMTRLEWPPWYRGWRSWVFVRYPLVPAPPPPLVM